MKQSRSSNTLLGLAAGVVLAAGAGILMGQGANQPVRSETQYFVTSEGHDVHLWVREGAEVRCVGHGECLEFEGHEHGEEQGEEHEGHDHAAPATPR